MSFRSRLRPLKRALAAPVERLWRPLVVALESRGGATEAWSPANGAVLVVSPHPDDEAIGCAGTILRHLANGDRVCAVIATDGRRSRALPDPDAVARLRHVEALRSAAALEMTKLEWIGLREGEWRIADLTTSLVSTITRLDPAVIYAPSRVDFHPEHFAVAHSLALAIARAESNATLRVYQVQVPLTNRLARMSVDVSAFEAIRAKALASYASQASTLVSTERLRRYCSRARGGTVECFWQMPAARYIELHREPPTSWATFRGLRNFPLSDPLAWMTRADERRRLARGSDAA